MHGNVLHPGNDRDITSEPENRRGEARAETEMSDIFDENDVYTGITVPKHTPLLPGQFKRHAVVILKTGDGYIMQQRSLRARYFPGRWDVTGGGVMAGEAPADAAVREAGEELGVTAHAPRLFHREKIHWENGTGAELYVYAARAEIPAGGMIIDPMEVNDVKIVGFDEFCREISFNKTAEFMEAMARIEAEY